MGMLPGSEKYGDPGSTCLLKRQDVTIHPDLILQAVKDWQDRCQSCMLMQMQVALKPPSCLPQTIPATLARGTHKQIALPDFQLIRATEEHICEGSLCEPLNTMLFHTPHLSLVPSSLLTRVAKGKQVNKDDEKCSAVATCPLCVGSADA